MNLMTATPLYELHGPFMGNRVFIKRDDLLPFSLGGNKVRIADAFFHDMHAKDCDTMIAYGNACSNLCRVIANRCQAEHIPCYIICSHDASEEETEVTSNSLLMEFLGAVMVHCDRNAIAPAVEQTMNRIREKGQKPYYIYGTKYGTGNEGCAAGAYAQAYREILEDQKRLGITFDYLFHASGTGSTQSGLVSGHLLAGDPTRIIGISISSRDPERGTSIIRDGVRSYLAMQGVTFTPDMEQEIHYTTAYRKGGYRLYDEEVLSCIRRIYRDYGIPLDPVYTGKAFAGMEAYLRENNITGKNILFLHTGGTPLFYDCLNSGELTGSKN